MRHPALLLLSLMVLAVPARAGEDKRNWFDDPFEQVSRALPACPVPEGPLLTHEQQRQEAHWRAERGTSCWLAGKCTDSNAYRYDKRIAPRVVQRLAALPATRRGSVWVTVQRRWVFLEGCVRSDADAAALEQAARAVPEVEAVVPALMVGTRGKPPYAVRAAAAR